jgi:hypothetical protein
MELNQCSRRTHWNKGKIVGQKAPLNLKKAWAGRIRIQLAERARDLALFNLGIDGKLRACDLAQLRVRDICHGERITARATVMQQKTKRPVQFEITDQPERSLQPELRWKGSSPVRFCSRAIGAGPVICPHANTLESFTAGFVS